MTQNTAPTLYTRAQSAFDRAYKTYDETAFIQARSAYALARSIVSAVKTIPSFGKVVDLGTGTGTMAKALYDYMPHAHFMLNDCSTHMLAKANCELPQTLRRTLHPGDMLDFMMQKPQTDVVVSNFALQWVQNWMDVVRYAAQSAPVVGVSLLVKGTFEDWYRYVCSQTQGWTPMMYPTISYIMDVLRTFPHKLVHYDFYEEHRAHQTPYQVMQHLKNLGAYAHTSTPIPAHILRRIYRDQATRIDITYRIIHIVLYQR